MPAKVSRPVIKGLTDPKMPAQVSSPVIRLVTVLVQPVILALQELVVLLPVMTIVVGRSVAEVLTMIIQDRLSMFRPSLRLWVFRYRQSSPCWKPGWRV